MTVCSAVWKVFQVHLSYLHWEIRNNLGIKCGFKIWSDRTKVTPFLFMTPLVVFWICFMLRPGGPLSFQQHCQEMSNAYNFMFPFMKIDFEVYLSLEPEFWNLFFIWNGFSRSCHFMYRCHRISLFRIFPKCVHAPIRSTISLVVGFWKTKHSIMLYLSLIFLTYDHNSMKILYYT